MADEIRVGPPARTHEDMLKAAAKRIGEGVAGTLSEDPARNYGRPCTVDTHYRRGPDTAKCVCGKHLLREDDLVEARNPERADAKTACGHSTAATCATCDPNGIAFSVTVEGIEPDTIYDPAVWVAIRRADLKKLDVLTVTQTAGQGSHSNSQGGAT